MEEDQFEALFATELDMIKDMDDPLTNSKVKRRLSFCEEGTHIERTKRHKVEDAVQHHAVVPPTSDHISITSFNGRRVFVEVKPPPQNKPAVTKSVGHLLPTPVSFLLDSISYAPPVKQSNARPSTVVSGLLWVDKYRPTAFRDLLSDERTNRTVLFWLKQWDKVVFGSTSQIETGPVSKPKSPIGKGKHTTNTAHNDGVQGETAKFSKIILLCGPPGLGKTTLAHVLAQHAGYNPVEINASDDRTAGVFEAKLLAATEMRSVMGHRKPNCLIIDEIDGVADGESSSAIDILVKLVAPGQGDGKVPSENLKPEKSKPKYAPLQRPIICICNDAYAPSLRRLRHVAQLFHFNKPSTSRIVSRLREICELEGLTTNSATLTTLVEQAEHDIRSCLNTLQLVYTQRSFFTSAQLTIAGIGKKDVSKGLYDVWQDVFSRESQHSKPLEDTKSRKSINIHDTSATPTAQPNSSFEHLYNGISSCNQTDKIVGGCFENYLSIITSDNTMNNTSMCADWLAHYDELTSVVHRHQAFDLTRYINTIPIAFHYKSATRAPTINHPKTDFEAQALLTHNKYTLQACMLNLPPLIYKSISKLDMVTDVISPFMDILAPTIRAVNPQLLDPKDRAILDNLVDIMATHHLTFTPEKSPKQATSQKYCLEPNLESLVNFLSLPGTRHHTLPPQLCELVISRLHAPRPTGKLVTYSLSNESSNKHRPPAPASTPSKQKPSAPSSSAPLLGPRFKFQEGFTNAVRRVVYVRDFLQ